jgi:hypothetical protein
VPNRGGKKKSQEELTIAGGEKPQVRRPRAHEWTKAKEQLFLDTLAQTCNVTLAIEAAGMSLAGAYAKRKRDAAFRASWKEAVGIAYSRLELVLLDRAFNGTEKLTVRRDGSEERMREYPNQIALQLLRMHKETAAEAAPENEPSQDEIEEVRQRLFDKLQRLRKRSGPAKRKAR